MDKILDDKEIMDKIPPIKARLLEYAEANGIKKTELCGLLSISYKNVTGKGLQSELGGEIISKILSTYNDIDPTWLLTGRGEPTKACELQEQDAIQIIHTPKVADPIRDDQVVPLYDLEAVAGLRAMLDNKSENIIDTIKIPGLPRCDGAVHVVGDSMYPILKSGDIVLYKEVQDVRDVFWGEMYLLSMQVDDEEYITVKYIQKSEEGKDYIKLVSHNQHHNPKDVPISSIRALALVKASIRLNTIA